jgi:hypothetical protein
MKYRVTSGGMDESADAETPRAAAVVAIGTYATGPGSEDSRPLGTLTKIKAANGRVWFTSTEDVLRELGLWAE